MPSICTYRPHRCYPDMSPKIFTVYPISRIQACPVIIYRDDNTPDQNPVENIGWHIKNHIRKNFMECDTFSQVKHLFESFGSGKVFDFSKMNIAKVYYL